jgi:hypothetical protein
MMLPAGYSDNSRGLWLYGWLYDGREQDPNPASECSDLGFCGCAAKDSNPEPAD